MNFFDLTLSTALEGRHKHGMIVPDGKHMYVIGGNSDHCKNLKINMNSWEVAAFAEASQRLEPLLLKTTAICFV